MKLLNEELVMTQEDKELLLRDLSARLPYGTKCIVTKSRTEEGQEGDAGKITYICLEGVECIGNEPFFSEFGNFKPYLFPLSSMTEEQKEEYCSLQQKVIYNNKGLVNSDVMEYVNWCYKNHIDINNLIPMGLAIDATGLNIY